MNEHMNTFKFFLKLKYLLSVISDLDCSPGFICTLFTNVVDTKTGFEVWRWLFYIGCLLDLINFNQFIQN